jgi:hypothetical protein
VQLPRNHIPKGLVPLERLFDGNDVALKGKVSTDDVDITSAMSALKKIQNTSNCQETYQKGRIH